VSRPVRIQRSRAKSWRMPPNTVSVTRPGRWGNPFRVDQPICMKTARQWAWTIKHKDHVCATAEEAVKRFAACLGLDDCMVAEVRKHLRGKNLACFCGEGQVCHADILLAIANSESR